MIETFPFQSPKHLLEYEDFASLADAFRKTIQAAIPGCGQIFFLADRQVPDTFQVQGEKFQRLALALDKIFVHDALVSVIDDGLLFSFNIPFDSRIVAFVDDVDALIIQRAAEDWLLDTREQLARQFLHCKKDYIDPETGLLNSAHLFEKLQSVDKEGQWAVVLAELPPRSRGLRETFKNAQRASRALKNFSGDRFLLHYLGQNVYALLAENNELPDLDSFSSSLVHYLKRENFFRVRVGSSQYQCCETLKDNPRKLKLAAGQEPDLLSEAWTALQEAAKRGPFSFCDFSLLANADQHPLRTHSANILARFRRMSSKEDKFCLIKLSMPETAQDAKQNSVVESLESLVACIELAGDREMQLLGTDRGSLFYLPGADGSLGLEIAKHILGEIAGTGDFADTYAGVSCFPYLEFSRSETLHNAHKALLHAEFFGPGHAVLFDAVSLNISGDIYFGDGNLARAIKEYRLGILCDGGDVNLLNSLGVTYALMNRDSLARKAFLQALELDDENYMAHYNLGLGAQQRADSSTALHHFTAAHDLCEQADKQQEICCDLRLQIGKLCCLTGEYEKSIQYLTLWMNSMPEAEQDRALRYLGEAYLGAGSPQQAMPMLQKLLRQTPFDAEVMSMLGEAVCLAGEGAEIALSFCNKAVELDPKNSLVRLRLAKVQYYVGESENSLASLKKCRGQVVDPVEVQLFKALAYADLKQKGRARGWAEKVLSRCEKGGELHKKADQLIAAL